MTIVMVTHDPTMAKYADKIIEVHDGKIISIR
jgi:ABC-type lipoprotein export system ATPase subunit